MLVLNVVRNDSVEVMTNREGVKLKLITEKTINIGRTEVQTI